MWEKIRNIGRLFKKKKETNIGQFKKNETLRNKLKQWDIWKNSDIGLFEKIQIFGYLQKFKYCPIWKNRYIGLFGKNPNNGLMKKKMERFDYLKKNPNIGSFEKKSPYQHIDL